MSRVLPKSSGALLLLLAAVYFALYARTIGWGWLGMDDVLLLRDNEHLSGGGAFEWALTDLAFGRRWLPIFWSVAVALEPFGVVGYRVASFLLGLALVLSIYLAAASCCSRYKAFLVSLIFSVSPLRLEVFGWGIGFLYSICCLHVVWSWYYLQQGRTWASVVLALIAVIVYPVAAGWALVVWYHAIKRREMVAAAWLAVLALCVLSAQLFVRVENGFVPVQHQIGLPMMAAAHYVAAMVIPMGTVPVVTPGFGWMQGIGALLIGAGLAFKPKWLLCFLVLLAPVLGAAYSEAFWYCGRYALIPAAVSLLYVAREHWQVRPVYLLILIGCYAGINVGHYGFRSKDDAIERAKMEERLLYGHVKIRLNDVS